MQVDSLSFFIIGISYKNANAETRGKYSLDTRSKLLLLSKAKEHELESVMAVSTCNRTEVLGFVSNPEVLINLLCEVTNGSKDNFKKHSYSLSGKLAINHLFKVGSGLESQILGDFEIIGQLKHSAAISKKEGLLNTYLERLITSVIRASKKIKTETSLSTGATSVSFASVQYICNNVQNINDKNILLFGTGKIGRNTCENLIKQTKNSQITLINRTKNKAEKIAGKFNLKVKDISNLSEEIAKADVLVVATGALETTVDKSIVTNKKPLLILDLSIPKNVSKNVSEIENIKLIHLDDLAKITDKTFKSREKEIPKALQIIDSVIKEFEDWLETRKFAPTIRALKSKLIDFKNLELESLKKKKSDFNFDHAELISDNIIQKITNHFAHHLINENVTDNKSEELIKKVFNLEKTL
jgi:glutamyl-tRNA reductase